MFELRRDRVPVLLIGLDGDCRTYCQGTNHLCTRRAVDGPSARGGFQSNLRSSESDHGPEFGPFPGRG